MEGMTGRFDGKVAIVTGSTRGIGLATAELMAEGGAMVVVTSRKAEACEAVAAMLREKGATAIGIPCHVARVEDRDTLVRRAFDTYGRIDIFVANAAVNPVAKSIQDTPDDAWSKIFETNLASAWGFSKAICPLMAQQGGGALVLVSSIAGQRAARNSSVYAVSKAALDHLAVQLATHWGPSNIRVNAVAPGVTTTDMIRTIMQAPDAQREGLARIPLGRFGEPRDVAEAIAFLASDAARQITGQLLSVDGGETICYP
jgi:NAD(P)-dependent dehydrogenase (short-subunit alcohol dehydrogenase family)